MSDVNDTSNQAPQQADIVKIPKKVLPEQITYDVEGLRKFIGFVFDIDNLEDDEHILVWKKQTHVGAGYPSESLDKFYKTLSRTKKPSKLYFGTSTTCRHETGELRNQKKLFKHLYVLVLDDIGTKIPVDKIPPEFKPSYIIETSKGNYQYGYVLEEPISVLQEAETLVQLVYEAGYSDAGGKMACKQVRLPDGVNGKPGDGRDFRVNLVSMDEDQLWTPERILEVLDIGVDWKDVVADADKVMKERANRGVGTSAWTPIKAQAPSLEGIVDPVAEWLYENDMVKQESDEWLSIQCPWSDTHTTGDDVANYSPLGWGGPEFRGRRSFNCFHDHCRANKSQEFLEFVAAAGGPAMPVSELAADLVSRYVFDVFNYGVWDIKRPGQPGFRKIESFNYQNPNKVRVPGINQPIAETYLFKHAANRVDVDGVTYDPTTTAKIVTVGGIQQVNLYTQPEWGDGEYDKADIKRWKQFIEYLIPAKGPRKFFLDWLAAKAQNMAFRGPAILMIAPNQGTGRSTLAGMLSKLFGSENLERVPFERLSSGGGQYNDWITKPIIVTDETLALGDDTNFYKVYERIKELIDTTPQEVRVNPKFGKQRFQMTYSSYLLFSNHENAMKLADNDRRVYVLNNAIQPESPEYFVALNDWLQNSDWERSLWRWLRKRKVDLAELHAPPVKTQAKDDLIRASKQAIDVAVEAVLDNWPTNLIASFQLKEVLTKYHHRFHLKDPTQTNKYLQRIFTGLTVRPPDAPAKTRLGETSVRVRHIKSHGAIPAYDSRDVTHEISAKQIEKLHQAVEDALSEHDF